MAPPTKAELKKGAAGYGYEPGDEDFLSIDKSPWDASASGHGYNARWKDNTGHVRGANWDDTDDAGLRNKIPDERVNSPTERMADLPYDAEGMGSGNALTGGGGPLSKNYGVGDSPPRYAPKKLGPKSQSNADDF